MPSPVAAVELRIWRHDFERQEVTGWPYTSQFNPENDRCLDTGRKTQRVFKVGFSFPLLLAALLVVLKKKHTGPFRTLRQPWVWNCVSGMQVMASVETNGSQSLSTTDLVRPSANCFASCWNAHGFPKAAQANSHSAGQSGSIWCTWPAMVTVDEGFFVKVLVNFENKDLFVQLLLLCYLFWLWVDSAGGL